MKWYLKVKKGFLDMANKAKADKREWAFMFLYWLAVGLVLLGWTALAVGAYLLAAILCAGGVLSSVGAIVILMRRA